jgi:transcriptional regulator with XRE-family HTH domain
MGIKLGEYIAERRKTLKLSQNALAKKAKVSASVINKLEAGVTVPSTKTLEALATALNLPLNTLLAQLQEKTVPEKDPLAYMIAQLSDPDRRFIENVIQDFLKYKKSL